MSDHDPFDGIYDSAPPAAAVEAERQKPDDKDDEPQDEKPQKYSIAFLRARSKADLQKIAESRDLDASGGRDALAERILEAQKS